MKDVMTLSDLLDLCEVAKSYKAFRDLVFSLGVRYCFPNAPLRSAWKLFFRDGVARIHSFQYFPEGVVISPLIDGVRKGLYIKSATIDDYTERMVLTGRPMRVQTYDYVRPDGVLENCTEHCMELISNNWVVVDYKSYFSELLAR